MARGWLLEITIIGNFLFSNECREYPRARGVAASVELAMMQPADDFSGLAISAWAWQPARRQALDEIQAIVAIYPIIGPVVLQHFPPSLTADALRRYAIQTRKAWLMALYAHLQSKLVHSRSLDENWWELAINR